MTKKNKSIDGACAEVKLTIIDPETGKPTGRTFVLAAEHSDKEVKE